MPVTQQQQQHHHHHHFFSAIGTFLHALQPSSHHINPNPNPNPSVIPPVSPVLFSHGSSELLGTYQAFETQVSQRLSSLLPAADFPCVSFPFLKDMMGLLIATQMDLRFLVPAHHKQIGTMEVFLERSVKILDACRGIKEQMLEMETIQGMIHLVILCLSSDGGERGQVSRARKALTQLLLHLEVEREDQTDAVHGHRSFRGRLRERLGGSSREPLPQRWRSWSASSSAASSWHGNNAPAHGNSMPGIGNHVPALGNHISAQSFHGNHGTSSSQTLHNLELKLSPPRLPPKDDEECFSAAIYALDVLSVFSLATITAALPCLGKAHSAGFICPPHTVAWASPFLRIQQRVDEELRKRSKNGGANPGLWELEQIFLLSKRLYELIMCDDLPKPDVVGNKAEVKELVKQLCQHGEELGRNMGALNTQINEFYNGVVTTRMGVLDMLSDIRE